MKLYIESYLKKAKLNNDILNYYDGRTILVTGGAGAIGSNLCRVLSTLVGAKGRIIILDNLSSIKTKIIFSI